MSNLDSIRRKIQLLYETHPQIHVNVTISRPKIKLKAEPAVIKGVYPRVFQLEEYSSGSPRCHTLQYTDVFTNQVEIIELKTGK